MIGDEEEDKRKKKRRKNEEERKEKVKKKKYFPRQSLSLVCYFLHGIVFTPLVPGAGSASLECFTPLVISSGQRNQPVDCLAD